jgi:molybdopterin molybdotransferase
MPEFLRLTPPIEALQIILTALPEAAPVAEQIDTMRSLGRVLAENVCAPHPLPEFPRSTVDGYAVRARDTFGVSEAMPGYLSVIGEIPMGAPTGLSLQPGTCASIHTGGMLPEGADAVIMLEYTQQVGMEPVLQTGMRHSGTTELEIFRSVAVGENMLRVGEDVTAGQVVLSAGRHMRPAEIGGCMALGITRLRVVKKPGVAIISSGDEVVPPEQSPQPGQVRDVNSHSLASLVVQAGGEPVLYGIIPDNLEAMKVAARQALCDCDLLVVTAGSSASSRDTTAEAIASLGAPGVLVHGVNIRPGKPTILAVCDGKAVVGLPGNPVSALVIAGLFVTPLIEKVLGIKISRPRPLVMAKITVNIPSQAGREDWVAVKLLTNGEWGMTAGERRYLAEPVFGKSNLIFSLANADGLVCIPTDVTGISAGDVVEVFLL